MSLKLSKQARSGAILICVLACLIVVTSLIAHSLQRATRTRREAKTYQRVVQAEWLVDLGVQTARAKLMSDTAYRGETLALERYQIHGRTAQVEIKIDAPAEIAGRLKVQVVATIGPPNEAGEPAEDSGDLIRRSYQFTQEMDPKNPSGE
ncbi:MAG: hypothetical protein AAF394_03320 [Planctomycetota bacterium]